MRSMIIMILIFSSISCKVKTNSFEMSLDNLMRLFENKNYSNEFIKTWDLVLAEQNDIGVRYVKDTILTYEVIKGNGFILTVNMPFKNAKKMISFLEDNYSYVNFKKLSFYKDRDKKEVVYAKLFLAEKNEIGVTVIEKKNKDKVYAFSVLPKNEDENFYSDIIEKKNDKTEK